MSLLSAFSAIYWHYGLNSGRQPGFALVLVFMLVDFPANQWSHKNQVFSSAQCDNYQSYFLHMTQALKKTALTPEWIWFRQSAVLLCQRAGAVWVLNCKWQQLRSHISVYVCSSLLWMLWAELGATVYLCRRGSNCITAPAEVFCLTKSTACLGMCSSTVQVPR